MLLHLSSLGLEVALSEMGDPTVYCKQDHFLWNTERPKLVCQVVGTVNRQPHSVACPLQWLQALLCQLSWGSEYKDALVPWIWFLHSNHMQHRSECAALVHWPWFANCALQCG